MQAAILPLGVIGPWQIVIILLVILIFFGGRKIPELMRGLGRGMKEFKDAVNKDYSKEEAEEVAVVEEKPARKQVAAKKPAAKKAPAKKPAAKKNA